MLQVKRTYIFFLVLMSTACEGGILDSSEQIYMQTEDSHPHEVLPGDTARFPFWETGKAGYIDVKCALSGPGVDYEIRFSGIKPKGWVIENWRGTLKGAELGFDIEGRVHSQHTRGISFDIVNHSTSGLLWHQCYNN